MATKEFTTTKREAVVVEFDLDGEHYTFTAPKQAELLASVVSKVGLHGQSVSTDGVKDLMNWLGEGLPEEQAERLLERLRDPEDDFDLPDINKLARYLLTQTSGRPTKRR